MYIGNTDEFGLTHLLWEVVSNSIDEFLAGRGKRVDISLRPDGGFVVSDDGGGIRESVDLDDALVHLHTTPTVEPGRLHRHVNAFGGVGLAVVAALAERLHIVSARTNVMCSRGEIVPAPEVERPVRGTRVEFVPDPQVFHGVAISRDTVVETLRGTCAILRDLEVHITPGPVVLQGTRGLEELLETAEQLAPTFTLRARTEDTLVDVAASWSRKVPASIRSFANLQPTHEHGSHVAGFFAALTEVTGLRKKHRELLSLAISVDRDEITHGGPTRSRIDTPALEGIVQRALVPALRAYFDGAGAAVREVFAASRPEPATSLLKRWRVSRAPEDADALDNVGLDAPMVAPRGAESFHEAWLQLAESADAQTVGWLAKTFFDRLPKYPRGAYDPRASAWRERVKALAPLAPDPRISAAVAKVLVAAPFAAADDASFDDSYGPIIPLITCDCRQASRLESWMKSPRGKAAMTRTYLAQRVPGWVEACRRSGPPRAASTDSTSAASRSRNVATLRSAVWANLDDVAARRVLADALIELGDPRGELIAAQLFESPKSIRLAKRLLRDHRGEWLGELTLVLTGIEFRQGFLFRASLAHNAAADASVWESATRHPELKTLRVLTKGRGNTANYLRFVAACPQLTDVEIHSREVSELLLEAPVRPVKHVHFSKPPALATLKCWAETARAPALESVRISGWNSVPTLRRLLDQSGLLPRLAELGVTVNGLGVGAVAAVLNELLPQLEVPSFSLWSHNAELRLSRQPGGFRLSGHDFWGWLLNELVSPELPIVSADLSVRLQRQYEKVLEWRAGLPPAVQAGIRLVERPQSSAPRPRP